VGKPNPQPQPGALFFSLLAGSEEKLDEACELLGEEFGEIVLRSEQLAFDHSSYYQREMGGELIRQWALTDRLIGQDEIVAIKLRANAIEDEFRPVAGSGRSVNIDPGFVTLTKVVLATTKDYSHRIYIANGIYAEATLSYRPAQGFQPWPWTYPDHCESEALEFFNEARARYVKMVKE
jgi:hypothetical protein